MELPFLKMVILKNQNWNLPPIRLHNCNLIGGVLVWNLFKIGSFLFLSTKHFDKYTFIKMFGRIKDLKYIYNSGMKSNKKPPADFTAGGFCY